MAPASNWLSFSLSPMEMLRSSSSSSSDSHQFLAYDASQSAAASSHHYFVDNFYANGWTNPKSQVFFTEEESNQAKDLEAAPTMAADSSILPSLTQSHIVPKLEDFFADSSSLVHSQTETQDSSLTQLYDHHHHGSAYFNDQQDLKAIAGFQAFSTNSGSEVDDSTSMARTQFPAIEFAGHSIESTGIELPFSNGNLSLGVNNNTTNINSGNKNQSRYENKAIVSADSDSTKKIADTFGQRTSIYRGVTRHRWTGRYEAHLWDNSCRREGQARKGRQGSLSDHFF